MGCVGGSYERPLCTRSALRVEVARSRAVWLPASTLPASRVRSGRRPRRRAQCGSRQHDRAQPSTDAAAARAERPRVLERRARSVRRSRPGPSWSAPAIAGSRRRPRRGTAPRSSAHGGFELPAPASAQGADRDAASRPGCGNSMQRPILQPLDVASDRARCHVVERPRRRCPMARKRGRDPGARRGAVASPRRARSTTLLSA
jgi:hypothetical protein